MTGEGEVMGRGGGPPRNAPPDVLESVTPWSPVASSIVCFAAVAILGYALQRLAAAPGEPDPRTLGPSVHTAYYWRVATALWWGLLAGIGGWRFAGVGPVVARGLPWVVVFAGVAAFLVP